MVFLEANKIMFRLQDYCFDVNKSDEKKEGKFTKKKIYTKILKNVLKLRVEGNIRKKSKKSNKIQTFLKTKQKKLSNSL